MAWYWWTAICVYIAIGSYIAGAWMNERLEMNDAHHAFLISITLIPAWWLFILLSLYKEFKQQIWDHFIYPVLRYTGIAYLLEKWQEKKEDEEELDKDERMGYKDYWDVR
jgi:hypothetical protein